MTKQINDLSRYIIKGTFVGSILPSKQNQIVNELIAILIKYCGNDYFIDTYTDILNSYEYKKGVDEINEKNSDGLVVCPYTSEWCSALREKELTTIIPQPFE